MNNTLIQVINKLQDVFQTVDSSIIQLPQIAVVGNQSAGKSSVIESIVGRTFLPRGTGIVTRRPLVLQLLRSPLDDSKYRSEEKGTALLEEWGEFLHKEGKIFTDFDAICKEIEVDTDLVAGSNKGICDQPINLRIYSTRVVDLTLVDLPGLTKVPIGDQPKDIEQQIKNLIFKYIENVNCIVLAVTAANADIATSEAMKFAQRVDPNGLRTLAVLTKIDLMDKGTKADEMLDGHVLPVKLGIIGVVNRSQQDIIDKKTIDEQLMKETVFFKREYPEYAERSGTPYLATTLSNLLINHIRDHLPDLQKRVNTMISHNQELLKSYGNGVIDKEHTLIRIITKFAKVFQRILAGTVRIAEGNSDLYCIIHKDFVKTLKKIQPTVDEERAKACLLENSAGPRPNLFDVPCFDVPFENLVKEHIERFMEPSLDLIQRVRRELKRNVQQCDAELKIEWRRFPKLKTKIFDCMNKLVSSRTEIAKGMVTHLIESEMAYINKKHPDFCKQDAIAPLVNYKVVTNYNNSSYQHTVNVQELTGSLLSGTKGEKENCQVLQNLVELYFEVVRKTVQDTVPKAIMFSVVNFVADNVESELFRNVYKTEGFEVLLDEANDISGKRVRAKSLLTALQRANEVINEVYEGGDIMDKE